jgi:hypothetical protein
VLKPLIFQIFQIPDFKVFKGGGKCAFLKGLKLKAPPYLHFAKRGEVPKLLVVPVLLIP